MNPAPHPDARQPHKAKHSFIQGILQWAVRVSWMPVLNARFRTINNAGDIDVRSSRKAVRRSILVRRKTGDRFLYARSSKVRAVTSRLFPLELPAAEYNNVFDDEFARRFGGATLKLLAHSNPDLKPLIKVTDAAD
ncbi:MULTISPECIES: hypothetical protein [unclassified Caballeronia]|uniref:hypothetical protein n=1 Tax=unclassified Caballeronia TaxID=2646786 RepID=UPI00285B18A8|nr:MULTISPECIES: hypothetical protein [unclassified Caballeronia]MDR5754237.1 hypothetical protein [Caballeronia sp. LZ024]MDR5840615.1 hypothetical protein [Caballeronia sp. LZ031]